ncbi:MAG: SagB/ThcOx family dehydrogenase [Candidatus Sumerlaeia bacterium]
MDQFDERRIVTLPPPDQTGRMSFEDALSRRRSVREFRPDPLSLAEIGQLLWAAHGRVSTGHRRTIPSAGAIYPLDVWLVAGNVRELEPGLYRYDSDGHALACAWRGDCRAELLAVALNQDMLLCAPATIVIAADVKRTAMKYGRRAARYVDMEAGHAGQNVYLQCAARNLGTVAVGAFEDEGVKRVLRLPDALTPLYLFPVGRIA